jgi:hypothetical protein
VGWSTDDSGDQHACIWQQDPSGQWHIQSLARPGTTSTASRVNQAGTVVDQALFVPGVLHAFRWNPGPGVSDALGVNAFDDIVGVVDPGPGGRVGGFRWTTSGGMQLLQGRPNELFSNATAINDHGVVVGTSDIASEIGSRAVIWLGDQAAVSLTDQVLQNPGWRLETAQAINNRGQITGSGTAPSGEFHGYLLSPVKAPILVRVCWPFSAQAGGSVATFESIQMDGGAFVRALDGRIIWVRPPRLDPLPFDSGPTGLRGTIRPLQSCWGPVGQEPLLGERQDPHNRRQDPSVRQSHSEAVAAAISGGGSSRRRRK